MNETPSSTPHPILICGPTASGKSALGLKLAERTGGYIVNADALQVYDNWRVLTARPSIEDEKNVEHQLYGHVSYSTTYSVGAWLRDLRGVLATSNARPIILGGTGLYFTTLTSGLTEIPEIPAEVRTQGNAIRATSNTHEFIKILAQTDPETLAKTDQDNVMRLQRAWEVLTHTGRGLSSWQKDTPPPMIRLDETNPIILNSQPEWLNQRIGKRFDKMLENGALDECRANLANWNPSLPASRALGAPELIAYLNDEITLDQARERATIQTRQFAKRQRTWFRGKMKNWHQTDLDDKTDLDVLADKILQND